MVRSAPGTSAPDYSMTINCTPNEVALTARGIATAVAPDGGPTEMQAALLAAVASALTNTTVDYRALEPFGPDELAALLAGRDEQYRRRIVHHMVLGELVLQPLPVKVAERVDTYARALGIEDRFVHVARNYARGAFGLAWEDLQRSGFVERAGASTTGTSAAPTAGDPELEARWRALAELSDGSLGRAVSDMYTGRGFTLPGVTGGPAAYLAQHDFVHVLADYGTNLKGELEVFALIGRANPDPKGFAWLATLIGLFETGFIEGTGFFERDVREHNIAAPGMSLRIADAIRRGKVICEHVGTDLFEVDFHLLAPRTVEDVREMLHIAPKAPGVVACSSPGVFDPDGMSVAQREIANRHASGM